MPSSLRRLSVVVLAAVACLLRCAPALPEEATVHHVIDGDTIEIMDGRHVRYIGIDAPEVRRRDGDRWVFDPQPFGEKATLANQQWVEGKRVRLEYDVQTHDRFGRLLAYVYVGEVMVNAELVREGFARLLTLPPNVKYTRRLRLLAEEARREGRGLWGGTSVSR